MKTDTGKRSRKRILLVEDEGLVRLSLRDALTRRHHVVVEANNGAEAFTVFSKDKFDLVVTDQLMPFLTGEELANRIRQVAPKQRILMITGSNYRRNAKQMVDVILQKPFDNEILDREVARLLAEHQ